MDPMAPPSPRPPGRRRVPRPGAVATALGLTVGMLSTAAVPAGAALPGRCPRRLPRRRRWS
ncbi:hypothetical protein HFP71_34765 [Streptomyces sp. ARC32]